MTGAFLEKFPHKPGGHCGSASMRDLLEFYGHEYSEEMVFGLGSGIDFVYFGNLAIAPPVCVSGRTRDMEENACGRLGVKIEFIHGVDAPTGWLDVKRMLDAGTPVMVLADVYHLDYLRAKRHFSAHRIVLVGYDEESGVAFVADNDREDIQECSLENLAKARSSSYPPQPADNAYYRMEAPERLQDLEHAIPGAIAEAVRHNAGSSPCKTSFAYESFRAHRGVAGLKQFAADMLSWPGSMPDETLETLCKSIYVSVEKGGTGYGGNFRRMYGRFLKEASLTHGGKRIEKIGDEFVAIGDVWSEMARAFKNHASDGAKAVDAAHPMALEIAEAESRVFEALDEANCGGRP
ncbi:MAG: hypothetical protein CVT63_05410 [Candidatus Anoxymicrobium japonicum]|uniref:DUF4872 domain-containing protein n=1 Tax=Candidatus Anoxymicrobium japonicum TaxID=2013648 RepID=A0A2N3G5D9_9ACTN|nr:MAG: hypothetical protein CVT63_05410 [Candidatus Anoxymicrobium japonicum]